MHTLFKLSVLLAASLVGAPASAQLYKWVDARGVTNYSSERPADSQSAKQLTQIENKVSFYTPDAPVMQAVKALQERRNKALSEPEPERQAVHVIGALPQSPYDLCLASGLSGCGDPYSNNTYYPAYFPGAVVRRGNPVHPTRFLAPPPVVASRALLKSPPGRMGTMR